MSKIEVNQISSQCGSTLTIGQSGDTVTLACGATQTGFGRTGTVDWCTTAKTAPFTGVSGKGYFVNTTCGAVTVTLPATPTAGDIISIKDYASTWNTNAITVVEMEVKLVVVVLTMELLINMDSTIFNLCRCYKRLDYQLIFQLVI
jgi:acetylornithine/succinyldiaminopimelate/putrescine aminotransferase